MSSNGRLRAHIASAGLTTRSLADAVGVDPKSVQRWITQGRVPHPRTRAKVAAEVGVDENELWPDQQARSRPPAAPSDLVQMWARRDMVPASTWRALLDAQREIRMLVYGGLFIVESLGLVEAVRTLSDRGGTARLLIGDPDSPVLRQRGVDEGLPMLPARAASMGEYLAPVATLPGVEIRTHGTPLYVSLYGGDSTMLVNPHTHGVPAKDSPVLHLHRCPGGQLWDYYGSAFDRVWESGTAVGWQA